MANLAKWESLRIYNFRSGKSIPSSLLIEFAKAHNLNYDAGADKYTENEGNEKVVRAFIKTFPKF